MFPTLGCWIKSDILDVKDIENYGCESVGNET